MLKKIGLFIIVVITIGLIIIAIIREPKQIKITTVKESYNYVALVNDEYLLDIGLLVNQKNSYITNINDIKNVYIGNDSDLYKVELNKIEYGFNTKIEKETYYYFNYKINLDVEFDIEIENAFLIIHYLNQKDISIDIGSISFYKNNDNNYNDISITNLKGIVNEVSGKKTLVGILFEIKNESLSTLNLENIFLFDLNVYISNIYELGDEVIDFNEDIQNIINREYSITDNEVSIVKEVDDSRRFLLTLGYKNHYQIPKLGFKIIYNTNGFNRVYSFPSFTFFNDHRRNIAIDELEFYIYEHN